MSGKIQVGYKGKPKNRKNAYAGRNKGKVVYDGGFNYEPTVGGWKVTQEEWDRIFNVKK